MFLKNWMNSESLKNACSLSLQASTRLSNLKSYACHKVMLIKKFLVKDMSVNWMTTQSTKYLQKFLPNVNALAAAPGVVTSPIQIDNTKYNDNVPGRFGELVEQLLYTGAYVLEHFQKYIITIADAKPASKESAQGKTVNRAKAWKSGSDYKKGDTVTHEDKVYVAIKASLDQPTNQILTQLTGRLNNEA